MTSSHVEPDWLADTDIIAINKRVVATTGEPHSLIRAAELASATARPLNAWQYKNERDILRLGLFLLEGLCRNHPFEQGNKRTAFAALTTFCERNQVLLLLPDAEWVAELVLKLVVRDLTVNDLHDKLCNLAIPAAP